MQLTGFHARYSCYQDVAHWLVIPLSSGPHRASAIAVSAASARCVGLSQPSVDIGDHCWIALRLLSNRQPELAVAGFFGAEVRPEWQD